MSTSETTRPGLDWQVDYITSTRQHAEACGVCLRRPEFCNWASMAVGRVSGVRLTTGYRASSAVCGDCLTLLLTGDWAGLERLAFDYQARDWTWWESIVHRRHARKVARRIAQINRALFANLADPDDAPHEEDAR